MPGVQLNNPVTGDRWNDHDLVMMYGYQKLFTPGRRGFFMLSNIAMNDLAVDKVSDSLAYTAVVDNSRVKMYTYGIGNDARVTAYYGTTSRIINDLPEGELRIQPTDIDMTSFPSNGESAADLMTGFNQNGDLLIQLWRIAAEPGH